MDVQKIFSILKTAVVAIILMVLAAVAFSPLFNSGQWINAHDTSPHLERLFGISCDMRTGDFYPRWLSMACLGKGSPVFNFYAPGFYLVVGFLHIIGVPLSIALKLFTFSIFFFGAWGMFVWTKKYFGRTGALLAATVYLFVPYHFLDLYVRGALPEFSEFALLPFLFHGIDLSFSEDRRWRGVMYTAITAAAIVITHNLSAFMIALFAPFYFFWSAFTAKASWKQFLIACAGPLLGAGLSAFYWLPVITETKHLENFGAIAAEYYSYTDHFVYPNQWFSSMWDYGASGPGDDDGMSFQIGRAILTCMAFGLPILFLSHGTRRGFGLITLLLGVFGIFMTGTSAEPVYKLIPGIKFIQFPWRFLGPATLFLAAFSGLAVTAGSSRWNRWLNFGLCLSGIILCVYLSDQHRTGVEYLTENLDQMEQEKVEGNKIGESWSEGDFVPEGRAFDPDIRVEAPVLTTGNTYTIINNFDRNGSRMAFNFAAKEASFIVVPWFYFPGWKARIDGAPVPVGSTPIGMLMVQAPRGKHMIEVWFGTTRPRVEGWIVALFSLLTMGYFVGVRVYRETFQRRDEDLMKMQSAEEPQDTMGLVPSAGGAWHAQNQ